MKEIKGCREKTAPGCSSQETSKCQRLFQSKGPESVTILQVEAQNREHMRLANRHCADALSSPLGRRGGEDRDEESLKLFTGSKVLFLASSFLCPKLPSNNLKIFSFQRH